MSPMRRWLSIGATGLLVLMFVLTSLAAILSVWWSMTPGVVGSLAWLVGVFLAVPVLGLSMGVVSALRWLITRKFDALFWVCLVSSLVAMGLFLMQGRVTYPLSIEAAGPVRAMQLPLEGRVVVGWGGDDVSTNYHAYYPAQRWAYDLMHEPFFTESDRLEDYGCYGKTIVSPVTGKVVFVKDGLIDQIPAKLPEGPVFPLGNSVGIALDEDEDIVVFMAHMMKGSVRVQEGQAIRAGAPVGRCGNSGNTSEPHVHIHAEKDPSLSVPELIGQVGTPVPISFYLKDGTRMPKGGEPPEIVEADRTLVQKSHALPVESSFPWTVRINDGNNNTYVLTYKGCCDDTTPATITVTPIQPEHSSSGSYSGGTPYEGTLTVGQREAFWAHIQPLSEREDAAPSDARPKGTSVVDITLPAGQRQFFAEGDAMEALLVFLNGLRAD